MQAFEERCIGSDPNGLQTSMQSQWRLGGKVLCKGLDHTKQIFLRVDGIHETKRLCLGRRDHAATQDELQRLWCADELWKALRSSIAGDDAEVDLGLTELGVLRCKTHVTGHGKLTSATKGKAVHGGDVRFAGSFNGIEDALSELCEESACVGVLLMKLGNISSGHKGLLTGTGDHNAADRCVGLERANGELKCFEHFGIQGVEFLRSIDREDRITVARLDKDDVVHEYLRDVRDNGAKLQRRTRPFPLATEPRSPKFGVMFRPLHHIPAAFLRALCSVLILLLLVGTVEARQKHRTTKKKTATAQKAMSSTKSKKAAKVSKGGKGAAKVGKTGRGKKKRRPRVVPLTEIRVDREREITPGVRYVQYTSNGSSPVRIHVVSMDRTVQSNALRLVKGEDLHDGLERLKDMAHRYDSTTNYSVLALVNGNFWRAYRNTAIGPLMIDGEIVEMNAYKNWSSAFFENNGAMTIDSFRISASLSARTQSWIVSSVNRRQDSTTAVIYNAFAGTTIPHIETKLMERAFAEALKDTVFTAGDSTEVALSQEQLKREILQAQREVNVEYPMVKIRMRYLRSPSVNQPIPCQVISVDTGTVDIPLRGCIASVPRSTMQRAKIIPGDTLVLTYSTNIHRSVKFMNAVSGTPRLVRNGVAKHEATREGSTGKRFIQQNLARTAIGTDKSGAHIFLVAVETTQHEKHVVGATLQQMAQIMRLVGCYNAMNLDGGGSSGMVVEGDHVFFDGEDPLTRRLSVGVGVMKRSHVLRSTVPPSND